MLKYIGSKLVNSNLENITTSSSTNQGAPIDNTTYYGPNEKKYL